MKDADIISSNKHEQLFKLRNQLESLTRLYIDNLFASQKSANEFAKILQTILESVADGLIVYDEEDNIILANEGAIRLCGLNIEHMSYREIINNYQFYDSDGKTPIPHERMPHRIAHKKGITVEKEGLIKGESLPPEGIWLRSHAAPIKDDNGKIFGVVAVFHDISRKKRLQLERDTLTSLITHDLKNHLSAMVNVLDLLSDTLANKLDAKDRKLLSDLKEDSIRYLAIANTLMEVYRMDLYLIDSHRTEINLKELLIEAIKLTEQFASNRDVQVILNITQELPMIMGIPAALRQVFHNLLHNAITASDRGQSIEITYSEEKNMFGINITDQGQGISKDDLRTLFEPGSVAHKLKGTSSGFGLYLSKQIIEAHGGTITCESEPNKGTTFSIKFPLSSQ